MTYHLNKKKITFKPLHLENLDGYPLASKNRPFMIQNSTIRSIIVLDRKLCKAIVLKKVMAKYDKLMKILTDLLVSDDDTGTCSREALNLIEKFRLEIKNKYRRYLDEKELKEMANKLKVMQKVALEKETEIKSFLAEEYIGRSR